MADDKSGPLSDFNVVPINPVEPEEVEITFTYLFEELAANPNPSVDELADILQDMLYLLAEEYDS